MKWLVHLVIAIVFFLLCIDFISYQDTQNVFSIIAFVLSGVAVGALVFIRGSGTTFDWSEIRNIWLYWTGVILCLVMVYLWPLIRQVMEGFHA
jgi:uncharacterized membrane protein